MAENSFWFLNEFPAAQACQPVRAQADACGDILPGAQGIKGKEIA
jgi:hypothetical protein